MSTPFLLQAAATATSPADMGVWFAGSLTVIAALIGIVYHGLAGKMDKVSETQGEHGTELTRISTQLGDGEGSGLIREVEKLRVAAHTAAGDITVMKARHDEEDRRHGPVDRRTPTPIGEYNR